MRVQTDFFLGTFEDLRDFAIPADGPAELFPTIEAEDVDVALLWELARIVDGTDLETFLRDTHLVEGPETPGELDKPTIELLPGALIDALLSIEPDEFTYIAERWSDVKEWRGRHGAETLMPIVAALVALATLVVEEEKLLFLWTRISEEQEL